MLCICAWCYCYSWWISMSTLWPNAPSNQVILSMTRRILYTVLLSAYFTENQRNVAELLPKHCYPLKFYNNIRTAGQQNADMSDWLLIEKSCHKRATASHFWGKCSVHSSDLCPEDLRSIPHCGVNSGWY